MEIAQQTIYISDYQFKDNTHLIGKLYRTSYKIAKKYFELDSEKRYLCYEQLCIGLDSIDENMCGIRDVKSLIVTVFEDGLSTIEYSN